MSSNDVAIMQRVVETITASSLMIYQLLLVFDAKVIEGIAEVVGITDLGIHEIATERVVSIPFPNDTMIEAVESKLCLEGKLQNAVINAEEIFLP